MSILQRILQMVRPASASSQNQVIAALKLIEEGQSAEKLGQLDHARRCYEQAVAIAPKLSKAHMNLGNVHRAQLDHELALTCYETAIELDPRSAAAHYNLGNVHWDLHRHDQAAAAYQVATALQPEFLDAWISLSHALASAGRHAEAVAAGERAVALAPQYAEAHFALSIALKHSQRMEEYLAHLHRAIRLQPDHFVAITELTNYQTDELDLSGAQETFRRALRSTPDQPHLQASLIFLMSHDPSISPDQLFAAHLEYGEIAGRLTSGRLRCHGNSREPERTLRVGFVSADLREHAVAHFVEPIFRDLSSSQDIMLFAYHNHYLEDQVSNAMKMHFSSWKSITRLTDEQVADLIAEDQIDILIDLSGHTYRHRLEMFALKPAPIQASWIGYPGTTGLSSMDYYLADKHFLPRHLFEQKFVEKLVYLPTTAPYAPYSGSPDINPLPALGSESITFASLNRHPKINRRTVALWARLLREVTNSRMVIGAIMQKSQEDTLARWFAEEGIEQDRLSFKYRCGSLNYLQMHHAIDICLDTFPYTGGTTIRHALWMGVPTLTIAGSTPASRQGSSILEAVGLGDFVAASEDEFVNLGKHWAGNTQELAHIRESMRTRVQTSPLGKPELISFALKLAFRAMWQRWCQGKPTDSIDVSNPTRYNSSLQH